jgi:ADP-ribose pyrophosphatase YjhB (NUDIX family)
MNEDRKKWVGGICIKDGAVLLVHRLNKERLHNQEYFIFPGLSVPDDESMEEALEDHFRTISLKVELRDLFYENETPDEDEESEYYYICDYLSGEPDPTALDKDITDGQHYTLVWVFLEDLEELIVYPETVKEMLIEAAEENR